MPKWMKNNALSITMFGAFLIFLVLQSVFGWHVRNEELAQAGAGPTRGAHYLRTGHFAEAVFENWESEFLQMGFYVLLTAYLVQRGSAESKKPDQDDRAADHPSEATPQSPRPVKVGGLVLVLYRNSLAIALLLVFVASFVLHLIGGAADYNEQQALDSGAPPISALRFPRHQRLLVPVHAELAERVPGGRRADRPEHLPAPARLAGVQTGHRRARGNRRVTPLDGGNRRPRSVMLST